MKTTLVNGKRESVKYRTNTEMYTRLTSPTGKTTQFSADVYNSESGKVVLVATSQNGSTLQRYISVISANEYDKILDLHDAYNASRYHFAIMSKLGFN